MLENTLVSIHLITVMQLEFWIQPYLWWVLIPCHEHQNLFLQDIVKSVTIFFTVLKQKKNIVRGDHCHVKPKLSGWPSSTITVPGGWESAADTVYSRTPGNQQDNPRKKGWRSGARALLSSSYRLRVAGHRFIALGNCHQSFMLTITRAIL